MQSLFASASSVDAMSPFQLPSKRGPLSMHLWSLTDCANQTDRTSAHHYMPPRGGGGVPPLQPRLPNKP
jgi:hypothetical protein